MHYPSTHDTYEDTKPCPVGGINLNLVDVGNPRNAWDYHAHELSKRAKQAAVYHRDAFAA